MKTKLIIPFSFLFFFACSSQTNNKESTNSNENDTITKNISAHQQHEIQYGNIKSISEEYWDSLQGRSSKTIIKNQLMRDTTYRVFGWHIYSNGTAYNNYNFSLLWGFSYFAYIVNPETGSYKDIHQWESSAIVDSAKAHDCEVYLTIANFGGDANATFLNNTNAQETLIDSVISLLNLREANGVNLDFEGLKPESKSLFTGFIKNISSRLEEKNFKLSICLYAVDYHKVFEISEIDQYIDFYTLMAYDYYGSFSHFAGPVTPLQSSEIFGQNSMESSVTYYLNQGIDPSKLIVGLPYYGAEWIVNDTAVKSKATRFISHPTYSRVKSNYIDSLDIKPIFNTEASVTYFSLVENDTIYRQVWFEDTTSLSKKYDWIKSQGLSGVGIWALGYDDGYNDLWNLLAKEFGE